MQIPYTSPINFDVWEQDILKDVESLQEEGKFLITGIVLHPQTMREIITKAIKNDKYFVPTLSHYFANLKIQGNSDIEQYEYRYEVGHIYRKTSI